MTYFAVMKVNKEPTGPAEFVPQSAPRLFYTKGDADRFAELLEGTYQATEVYLTRTRPYINVEALEKAREAYLEALKECPDAPNNVALNICIKAAIMAALWRE